MRIILILLVLIFGSINSLYAQGPSIVNSLEDAMALSESTKMPTLVIFGAEWCGYCTGLKNDINNGELNKELDSYIICYIDVDKNKDVKKEYKVRNLPDSRILKNKIETEKITGYEKNRYKKWINDASKR